MNIRKIIAEELRKILKESIDSAFVRKYLSVARPTKTQYFVGLEFIGPMGDELFKSYKDSKSTPAVKQLYAMLKPYNLQLERNTKKNLLIFGDKEDMVKFLRVLEAAGTTFVKKFNESVVTEANVRISGWSEKIPIIGITKDNIRDLSKGCFGPGYIFATPGPECIDIANNIVKLRIQLSNAGKESCTTASAKKYIDKLNKISKVPLKFVRYSSANELEDMHDYEPTKVSPGTTAMITTRYIHLISTKSNITEATDNKMTVAEIRLAVKKAGYKEDAKESTPNAIKFWAYGGNFNKLVKLMRSANVTAKQYPADPGSLSDEEISGSNFIINRKTADTIYFAILKAPGKELADIGYDY